MSGSLYLVSTPLGNLGDMTPRALETLQSVDIIAAEDTRHTGKLLKHFAITTNCIALHDHNESQQLTKFIERLIQGDSIALVSDAGTPLIADPGYKLVRAVAEQNIAIVPVPGACAIITALVASGLPTDQFCFAGFVPSKANARTAWLKELANSSNVYVMYETKHRLIDSLAAMALAFGAQSRVCVAREMTKQYESFYRGTLMQLQAELAGTNLLGEFVVVLEHKPLPMQTLEMLDTPITLTARQLLELLDAQPSKKQVASWLGEHTDSGQQQWYRRLVAHMHE